MAKKKKHLSRFSKILLDIIMVAALGTAGFSAYQIYKGMEEDREGEKSYEEIRESIGIVDTSEEEIGIDWDYLLSVNKDVGGWIRLDDSVIDYPFVYPPNNSYYLRRLLDGKYNRNGTIFADYRNQRNFQDRVTVLYGHHMHSGAMFADIEKYKEPGYYESHPVIQIFTPEGNYELHPAAGYVTTGYADYVRFQFADDEDFMGYINDFYAHSAFTGDTSITAQDKVILISTCSYEIKDGRFALIGKLVPVNAE